MCDSVLLNVTICVVKCQCISRAGRVVYLANGLLWESLPTRPELVIIPDWELGQMQGSPRRGKGRQ